MTRHYKKPVLLIEFSENRPFSLQVSSFNALLCDCMTCLHCRYKFVGPHVCAMTNAIYIYTFFFFHNQMQWLLT